MTNDVITALLAVGAAALFAFGTAAQHHGASRVQEAGLGPRLLIKFASQVALSRLWLFGLIAEAVGLGLHAAALHLGTLVLVQPLMVTSLLFALPVRSFLDHERVTHKELRWAVALVGALSVFLIVASPGSPPSLPDLWPAVSMIAGAVLVGGICIWVAQGRGNEIRAACFGIATGIAFAGVAALLKACTDLVAHGLPALIGSWQFWAFLGTGAVGVVLNQLAYQAGPLAASLPAISAVNPVVSVMLGVFVYDENLRHGALAVTAEGFSAALMVWATVVLARQTRTEPVADLV